MAKKLLLADDSLTIQKVVGIVFANLDYQLLIAENGDVALDLARKEFPDLVIADIGMPGKDGFELCREIKNDPDLGSVPVLLLPGAFENFDEAKATQVGADGWINKPFESQALISKVEELLAAAPEKGSAPVVVPEPEPEVEPPVEAAPEPEFEVELSAETPLSPEEDNLESSEVAVPTEPASPVVEEVVEESDDIWDAVTFEEEDLQADVAETVTSEESPVVTPAADLAGEEAIQFEEPAPLMEEPLVEVAEPEDEIIELGEDDIIELEGDAIIEELPEDEPEPVETSPITFEDEPVVETVDFSAPQPDAESQDDLSPVTEPALEVDAEPALAEEASPEVESISSLLEPVAEAEAPTEPVSEPEQEPDVAAVEEQLRNLDESAIEAVVKKVAGPLVEKMAAQLLEQVVWEVVPDLAEALIKDEIRKIKEGAA